MSGAAVRGSNRKAQVLTVAVLALVMAFSLARMHPWGGAGERIARLLPASGVNIEPTPEDAIYGMLDAARAGDVTRYLASYSGPMASSLKQSFSGKPANDFARYLREFNAGIKGVTVMVPQPTGANEVKVRVDYTYTDRTESQDLWLEKSGNLWTITRADAAEQIATPIPYGAAVRD